MDELGGFEPTDTTGFIQIESIRIKKWVPVSGRYFISDCPFLSDGPKLTSERARLAWRPKMSMAVACKMGKDIEILEMRG
jgi:hypothetical protein